MTNTEFSNQFDTLVNSYRRFKDFDNQELLDSIEFDELEKSQFLTKAQEELVVSLYNGRNAGGESFEETEELRRSLSNLIAEAELDPITNTSGNPIGMDGSHSYFFTLPDGNGTKPAVWFITYESVTVNYENRGACGDTGSMEVIPIRQDEYHKIKHNPYRGANNRRSLRLDLSDNNVEIISKYTVTKYYIRYLKKLNPIVLTDMPNGVTVNGEGKATECELDETLHQRILENAVLMAVQSKLMGVSSKKNKEE